MDVPHHIHVKYAVCYEYHPYSIFPHKEGTLYTANQFIGIFFTVFKMDCIVLIDLERYDPNFWKWWEGISIINCPANTFHATLKG